MNCNYLKKFLVPLVIWYLSFNCYSSFEVTHDDIRDAILSLAHLMRENTEKLERHEFRDRQMDEQLRKAIMAVARKIQLIEKFDSQFDVVNGKIDTVEKSFIKSNSDVMISNTKFLENIDHHLKNSSMSCSSKDTSFASVIEPLQKIFELEKNFNETLKTLVKSDDDLTMLWLANITNFDEKYQSNTNEIKSLIQNSSQSMKLQYEKVDDNLKVLIDGQSIMITIADHILEMKKKIEYGNHQLSSKMEYSLDIQNEKVDAILTRNMLELEQKIITNSDKLNTNISNKIEVETSQVWRQINIMSQQIIHNNEAILKFENKNEAFVNQSRIIIDNLSTKVDVILKKIPEIDEKMNYFLGKLALLMQEFNQVTMILKNSLNTIN